MDQLICPACKQFIVPEALRTPNKARCPDCRAVFSMRQRVDVVTDAEIGYGIEESHVDDQGVRHITKARLYEVSLVRDPRRQHKHDPRRQEPQ